MSTLYRKYRPQSWEDVAGQNHVKVTLSFEVQTGRIAHAYLFSGPRGIGKTTIARILARAVNCDRVAQLQGTPEATGKPCGECDSCRMVSDGQTLDIIEIDAASHRGIDAVRENIIENSRFSPSRLRRKVFIIDEVHMLTNEAFNALLKTIEEPPEHAMFVLATTELHKVPATIVSRCQRFDFRKIPFEEMTERLAKLAAGEGVSVDRETLDEIARTSEGCLRDAESLLGKVLTVSDGKQVTHEAASVVMPRSDWRLVAALVEAVLRRETRLALTVIDDAIESGAEAKELAEEIIETLRLIMLTKLAGNPDVVAPNLDEERKRQLLDWSEMEKLPRLVHLLEAFMAKAKEVRAAHPPQLPLELAIVAMSDGPFEAEPSVAAKPVAKAPVIKPAPVEEKKAPRESVEPEPPLAPAPAPEPEPISIPTTLEKPATTEPAVEVAIELPVEAVAAITVQEIPDGEAVCTLADVTRVWNVFVQNAAKRNFSLPYLLGVGRPVGVSGITVAIGFEFNFHCEKLISPKNRVNLEDALSEALGKKVRLESRLLEKTNVPEDATSGSDKSSSAPVSEADGLAAEFGGLVQ